MTFLPFVFQMQSLLMEAFNTQTKPTIKTDDLFTIQTNHFSIKPNNLGFEMKLVSHKSLLNLFCSERVFSVT